MTSDINDTTDPTVIQMYRIYIQASAERIWEAITQPEWTEKYYYGTRVDIDLTPGGAYRAVPGAAMLAGAEAMGFELPDVVVQGEVIIADPPHTLAHTWQLLMDPTVEAEGFTTVTWELLSISDDVTKVTVTHDVSSAPATALMVHGDGEADGNGGGGWDQILSSLKTLLETGEALQLN
jgi:uncharacterized protein YndB with AHSA1/START domain